MTSSLRDFPEAIIVLDTGGQIVGINLAGERLLKIKRMELLGKSVDVVFTRQTSSVYKEEILTDGRKNVSIIRSDGQTINAELMISTINGPNGKSLGQVAIIRGRKQTQHTEMQEKQEASLKSQNLVLRALQETTFELHSSLDLDGVLHNIVDRACRLLGTSHGYLDIMRETGEL